GAITRRLRQRNLAQQRYASARFARQREIEGRALADSRLRPDAAAMAQDDLLHQCEADTRALEFAGAVQPLEGAEQARGMRHVEARAAVGDEVHRLAVLAQLGADADLRLRFG